MNGEKSIAEEAHKFGVQERAIREWIEIREKIHALASVDPDRKYQPHSRAPKPQTAGELRLKQEIENLNTPMHLNDVIARYIKIAYKGKPLSDSTMRKRVASWVTANSLDKYVTRDPVGKPRKRPAADNEAPNGNPQKRQAAVIPALLQEDA